MSYGINQITGGSESAQRAQLNRNLARLDAEQVVKQFNGANGTSLVMGKTGSDTLGIKATSGDNTSIQFGQYQSDRYGLLLYDENGVPRILIGQAPDDARIGSWVSEPGENVLTLLGG